MKLVCTGENWAKWSRYSATLTKDRNFVCLKNIGARSSIITSLLWMIKTLPSADQKSESANSESHAYSSISYSLKGNVCWFCSVFMADLEAADVDSAVTRLERVFLWIIVELLLICLTIYEVAKEQVVIWTSALVSNYTLYTCLLSVSVLLTFYILLSIGSCCGQCRLPGPSW